MPEYVLGCFINTGKEIKQRIKESSCTPPTAKPSFKDEGFFIFILLAVAKRQRLRQHL